MHQRSSTTCFPVSFCLFKKCQGCDNNGDKETTFNEDIIAITLNADGRGWLFADNEINR